jgi:hypothetical protein
MTDRRPTVGTNWNAREPVGIRKPRPRRDYGTSVLERLEEELRQLVRDEQRDEAAR